jgi:plasmid maintenance system antidote protein VapI
MKKRRTHLEKQIRAAIKESGLTIYRLAKDSGVPQPVLSRFLNAKRGITLTTASKLAEALELELVPKKTKRTAR